MKALVLLSGGMDSTTCLALAKIDCDQIEALSFLYGQKHSRELEAAKEIAAYYSVPHGIVSLPRIFSGFGSTLTDDIPNPHLSYEELRSSEGPSPTYVPYRNGSLLSLAAVVALTHQCDLLYFGAHADDAHHEAYPDCTPEFIGSQASAILIGSYYKLRLRAPLTYMTKAEVAKVGYSLGVPFNITYSCYEGGKDHCGLCPTCISRKEAFRQGGIVDPTLYYA